MSLEAALRQPSAADAYERSVVPAIFDRYARDLVERARLHIRGAATAPPVGADEPWPATEKSP